MSNTITETIKLTDPKVEKLPPGRYKDQTQPKLFLVVTPAGARIWQFYGWLHGKPHRAKLGRWPAVTVEKARATALDIAGSKSSTAASMRTLAQVVADYLAEKKANRTSYMQNSFKLNWQQWKDTRLDKITENDIRTMHDAIAADRGAVAAREAVEHLGYLFKFADLPSQTGRVQTAKRVERNVYLNDREVGILRKCLEDAPARQRDFFLLALLTGLRRNNVLLMRWDWICWDEATVTIPGPSSKNGKEMQVPLVPEALEILRTRKASADGPYVFAQETASGCVLTPRVQKWKDKLSAAMLAAGVTKKWRLHDLRRTCATRMASAGAPVLVIGAVLGHNCEKTTRIYAQSEPHIVRKFMEAAARL